MSTRVMIISGEASGDLHGAGVVRELKRREPDIEIYGVGGDRMHAAGMELIIHSSELSFMGFLEVVKNLRPIRQAERKLDSILRDRKPDVVVLIDYPGFNLRFARKAKGYGIRTLYYISPQVWAWKPGRVHKIRACIDQMKVVFPFEVEIYRNVGLDVEFVGHPLVESLHTHCSREEFLATHGLPAGPRILAILPGSRKQEIEVILPTMCEAARVCLAQYRTQAIVGVAPGLDEGFVRQFIPAGADIRVVANATHDLMQHADAALVTSGTATLEAGWFGTPMVVVYKTSPITYAIGRMLVNVPYIGLVNIVAGRKIVQEYVQQAMTVPNLAVELGRIFGDEAYRHQMKRDLSEIREKLGAPGASARVAESILQLWRAA
jgi:lipid-A-disaccharide synthase